MYLRILLFTGHIVPLLILTIENTAGQDLSPDRRPEVLIALPWSCDQVLEADRGTHRRMKRIAKAEATLLKLAHTLSMTVINYPTMLDDPEQVPEILVVIHVAPLAIAQGRRRTHKNDQLDMLECFGGIIVALNVVTHF